MKYLSVVMAALSLFCFGFAAWIPFDWKNHFPNETFLFNPSLGFVFIFLFLGFLVGSLSLTMWSE